MAARGQPKYLFAKGVDTQVSNALFTSLDHETLLTKISLPRHTISQKANTRFHLDTMDEQLFEQMLETNAARLAQLSELSANLSIDQLDNLAQGIIETLVAAMKASIKRASGRASKALGP
ncbi:hypothetical protein VTO42DRAFT_2567 [Malbranchea cinnamomea]